MSPTDLEAPPTASNGDAAPRIGPHPGYISSSNQYASELKIRRMLKENGCDPAREDNYRLQGVQLIDTVRQHLNLCVVLPDYCWPCPELTSAAKSQAGADI